MIAPARFADIYSFFLVQFLVNCVAVTPDKRRFRAQVQKTINIWDTGCVKSTELQRITKITSIILTQCKTSLSALASSRLLSGRGGSRM
jgi:hypothetical protein